MTPLVPLAMYGWVFLTIALFYRMPARKAVIVSVIGGFLFLPMSTFDLPIIPEYSKYTAIAFGLVLGGLFSGESGKHRLALTGFDLPMLLWCTAVPLLTSLTNGLGLRDGISDLLRNYLGWGAFYWAGRRYFGKPESLRELTRGMLVGGVLYIPLILFEIRMSPQLSNIFYGFFPHSFLQHFRYGGYRPIVFMQHGLMVALWMAATATITFFMWRSRQEARAFGFPIALVSLGLAAATVLCKSANGWFFLAAGVAASVYYAKTRSVLFFRLMFLAIPLYIIVRLNNIVPVESVQELAGRFFDAERVDSLAVRLMQENLFGAKAMERALFGWGGYNRGWPVDPATGEQLIQMVDSLWIILFSMYGLLGLGSIFLSLGLGPWAVLKLHARPPADALPGDADYAVDAVALSLVIGFFLFDSLLNAMVSPAYILCAGALVSYHTEMKNRKNIKPEKTEGTS